MNDSQPFTPDEKLVMDCLVNAHNAFTNLPETHPSDLQDWLKSLHDLQRILSMRILRRDYPDHFYSEKK